MLACLTALATASDPTLRLDLNEGWKTEIHGAWQTRVDHRQLLVMRHPWLPSNTGDFAFTWRMIQVPNDWQGPVSLSFYCSDDYHTDAWRPDGSWLTAEGFIGHRFKRVLVDNRPVWNLDVCDPVVKGQSPVFRIPLEVRPGQLFQLGLLAYDAEASTIPLPNDFYQSANNERKREDDPDASNFMTHVYWGDIVLLSGDANPPVGRRPAELKVRAVHNRRWPLPPLGDGWTKDIVRFEVSAPSGIPKTGFPLEMGIPLPAGKVHAPAEIRFQLPSGHGFYAQKNALGEWPDESLKWVFAAFPISPVAPSVDLCFKPDQAALPGKLRVEELYDCIRISGDPLGLEVRKGNPLVQIRRRSTTRINAVRLSLLANGEEIPGTATAFHVLDAGPFRIAACAEGSFDALDRGVATFTLNAATYQGLPYLKLWLRLFNNTKADLNVSGLKLIFELPKTPARLRVPGATLQDGFTLTQLSEKARSVDGSALPADLPFFLEWEQGVIVVRNFRELFPKQARADGQRLIVDLAAGGDTPVVFTPGEAKTHEVWLALGDVNPEQFAAIVHTPPILQNPAYFCATGVLGRAYPFSNVPKLEEKTTETYKNKRWEDLNQHFGLRHFPDSPYYGSLPNWSNNYCERMLGLWSAWFLSGDRAWYDRAIDVCRHLMDVAIIHSEIPGKDWLGAMHGPGINHVPGPWNPTLRIAGLDLYHKLTGDPDALDAFLGVADFCIRTGAGIDGGSVRQQAGPFDAICTAYAETGATRFLDAGTARVASVWRAIDRRRGVWPDEHGARVYRGNVPWMIAQIARPLYEWYYLTGDEEAAQALVALAESIICENTAWDAPGQVSGYSHNPRFPITADYDPLIIPIIFAAYELTEDPFFREAGEAQWQRWLHSDAFDSIFNTFWNTPWLVWYLHHYGILPDTPKRR